MTLQLTNDRFEVTVGQKQQDVTEAAGRVELAIRGCQTSALHLHV